MCTHVCSYVLCTYLWQFHVLAIASLIWTASAFTWAYSQASMTLRSVSKVPVLSISREGLITWLRKYEDLLADVGKAWMWSCVSPGSRCLVDNVAMNRTSFIGKHRTSFSMYLVYTSLYAWAILWSYSISLHKNNYNNYYTYTTH